VQFEHSSGSGAENIFYTEYYILNLQEDAIGVPVSPLIPDNGKTHLSLNELLLIPK